MAGPSLWFDMWFQSTCPITFLPPERGARTRTVLSATQSRKGTQATGTLVSAILLAVIRNGLNLLNVSSFWQQIVIGLVIALAVGFDVIRNKTAN